MALSDKLLYDTFVLHNQRTTNESNNPKYQIYENTKWKNSDCLWSGLFDA